MADDFKMATTKIVAAAEPPNLRGPEAAEEPNSSAPTSGTAEHSARDASSSDAVQNVGSPEAPLSAVDTSAVVVQEKGACTSKEKDQRSEEEGNEQKGAGSPTPAGYTACVISSSLPALPPTTLVKPKDLEYQGPTDESK